MILTSFDFSPDPSVGPWPIDGRHPEEELHAAYIRFPPHSPGGPNRHWSRIGPGNPPGPAPRPRQIPLVMSVPPRTNPGSGGLLGAGLGLRRWPPRLAAGWVKFVGGGGWVPSGRSRQKRIKTTRVAPVGRQISLPPALSVSSLDGPWRSENEMRGFEAALTPITEGPNWPCRLGGACGARRHRGPRGRPHRPAFLTPCGGGSRAGRDRGGRDRPGRERRAGSG